MEFYQRANEIDRSLGLEGKVCHETHRKRCLFHPLITAQLCAAIPSIRLTLDISHWIVVCERLLDKTEADRGALRYILPHVRCDIVGHSLLQVGHLHTRIGTTQISQCPDPLLPVFAPERKFFERVWVSVVEQRKKEGADFITFVAEYG